MTLRAHREGLRLEVLRAIALGYPVTVFLIEDEWD